MQDSQSQSPLSLLKSVLLQACPSPSHPSHPGVSEQTNTVHWRGAGGKAGRSRWPAGSSSSQPCPPCRLPWCAQPQPGCSRIWSLHTSASLSWQASPSSSFHFSSLVSIVFLFGELESMTELEMWLASASDAAGWVFTFQIGLSLSTSSPGQLKGCTALL